LPGDFVDKLKRLSILILEKFENQGDFALVLGEQEMFVSRVFNGRCCLKPEEKEVWATTLKCDYSFFPDPPTFKKSRNICHNYQG
jgi:hypothetical protein